MTKVDIYSLTQCDPVLVHEYLPARTNKHTNKHSKFVGKYARKMRVSLKECKKLQRMAHRQIKSKWQNI